MLRHHEAPWILGIEGRNGTHCLGNRNGNEWLTARRAVENSRRHNSPNKPRHLSSHASTARFCLNVRGAAYFSHGGSADDAPRFALGAPNSPGVFFAAEVTGARVVG
ncbi:unnamed protein product [Lampetra planeri]